MSDNEDQVKPDDLCHCCGYDTELKPYAGYGAKESRTFWLCHICASTFLSHSVTHSKVYSGEDRNLFASIGWIANHLESLILSQRDPGGGQLVRDPETGEYSEVPRREAEDTEGSRKEMIYTREDEKREVGYYWVDTGADWCIGYWNGIVNGWNFFTTSGQLFAGLHGNPFPLELEQLVAQRCLGKVNNRL